MNKTLNKIKKKLAGLYDTSRTARFVARKSGLDIGNIAFTESVNVIWDELINEARKTNKIEDVLIIAIEDYPSDELKDLLSQWKELPKSKTIQKHPNFGVFVVGFIIVIIISVYAVWSNGNVPEKGLALENASPSTTITTSSTPPQAVPASSTSSATAPTPDLLLDKVIVSEPNPDELVLEAFIRNIGVSVALISEVELSLLDAKSFSFNSCVPTLIPTSGGGEGVSSTEFEIKIFLSDLFNEPIVKTIPYQTNANEGNHIVFDYIFETSGVEGDWHLIRSLMTITYNGDAELNAVVIFLLGSESPQSAMLTYGHELSDEDLLTKYPLSMANNRVLGAENPAEEHVITTRWCLEDRIFALESFFTGENYYMSEEAVIEYNEWKMAWGN